MVESVLAGGRLAGALTRGHSRDHIGQNAVLGVGVANMDCAFEAEGRDQRLREQLLTVAGVAVLGSV